MRFTTILCVLCCLASVQAKAIVLNGWVYDSKSQPLTGVSVALLYPSDSTLATFAISGKDGSFHIKDAVAGTYVLQASLPGYYTEYEQLELKPGEPGRQIQPVVMQKNADEHKLSEVIISGERIPLKIKGDTVEYNAASYRVKPNAPVEELLRQLPGMQVDERGNIKAMGKEVKKVLVDGKEFFGSDPKIATRNLPADAVDKIQTFGKHSDASEFSGIDDGTRDQTINVQLKDGKKKGYFGAVKAGAGSGERFESGAKVFRFRPKKQFAALASANNINQFGFSFDDYINFNGGLGGLMNGGVIDAGDLPIDFGQPVTGKNTSAAAGLNFSVEPREKNRFMASYIGTGMIKEQQNATLLRNYVPNGAAQITNSASSVRDRNLMQGVLAKWNNQLDSQNHVLVQFSGQLKIGDSKEDIRSSTASLSDTVNRFRANNNDETRSEKLDASAAWTHKIKRSAWKTFQVSSSWAYQTESANYIWNNATTLLSGVQLGQQFQDNLTGRQQSSLGFSSACALWGTVFLEPKLAFTYTRSVLRRDQGDIIPVRENIDSLSPDLLNNLYVMAPSLGLRSDTRKQQWSVGLQAHLLRMQPRLNDAAAYQRDFRYLLPYLFWRRETGENMSLEFNYNTRVQAPQLNQLLSVQYSSSPLYSVVGDENLRPEYIHEVQFGYRNFNQFEMASLFAGINASYTADKIGTAIQVLPNLGRQTQWVNTPYAARVGADISYSRPVKLLAIDVGADLNEQLQLSQSPVNGVANKSNVMVHHFGVWCNNRKHKDRWNARLGAEVQLSEARYSISRELNNVFYHYSGSAAISYQPAKQWYFGTELKWNYYSAQSFERSISIPLLGVELTRYLFAAQRVALTLKGFDLLNKNRSVIRQGLSSGLAEQTSNVIQRYVMFTCTYKLTKVNG